MPRNCIKAVPEGNGPVPQEESRSDQFMLADVYRCFEERFDRQLEIMESHFDRQEKKLGELMEKTRKPRQRSASLEHDDARQPRFATEADVKSYKKTRKRTKDAAVGQAMNEDSCSAKISKPPNKFDQFRDES